MDVETRVAGSPERALSVPRWDMGTSDRMAISFGEAEVDEVQSVGFSGMM